MNSALPRMVQPVSSEARLSLMRGVRPTAAATPLANGKGDLLGFRTAGAARPAQVPISADTLMTGGACRKSRRSRIGSSLNADLTPRGQAPPAFEVSRPGLGP